MKYKIPLESPVCEQGFLFVFIQIFNVHLIVGKSEVAYN